MILLIFSRYTSLCHSGWFIGGEKDIPSIFNIQAAIPHSIPTLHPDRIQLVPRLSLRRQALLGASSDFGKEFERGRRLGYVVST